MNLNKFMLKEPEVSGTLSQGIRGFDLRRSRYMGLAKTSFQHIAVAVAMNLSRLADWWADRRVISRRQTPFAALKNAVYG